MGLCKGIKGKQERQMKYHRYSLEVNNRFEVLKLLHTDRTTEELFTGVKAAVEAARKKFQKRTQEDQQTVENAADPRGKIKNRGTWTDKLSNDQ